MHFLTNQVSERYRDGDLWLMLIGGTCYEYKDNDAIEDP